MTAQRLHPRGSKSTYTSGRSFHLDGDLAGSNLQPLEESWSWRDIDLKFICAAQHYGTAVYAIGIVIALGVVHHIMEPRQRVFFVYDASISCELPGMQGCSYVKCALQGLILSICADVNFEGDTFPAYAAIITPLGCLALSLFAYEFFIFRSCAVPSAICDGVSSMHNSSGSASPLTLDGADLTSIQQASIGQTCCKLPVVLCPIVSACAHIPHPAGTTDTSTTPSGPCCIFWWMQSAHLSPLFSSQSSPNSWRAACDPTSYR